MAKKTIEEAWESYLELIVSDTAGSVQIDETRKAFYSGASSLYFAVLNSAVGGGEEVKPEDITFMESIDTEITEFHEQMTMLCAVETGVPN